MSIIDRIEKCGVVPVIVLRNAESAVPVARALLTGGIGVMEITFRTDAASDAIANVAREVPEMLVGAGTVISDAQLERAVNAGAKFIVSPGSDAELIKHASMQGVPIFPGVTTASEIMLGLKLGITVFKFFPAETSGGINAIKALAAPFPGIRFIPTGGISPSNAADYLAYGAVAAIGGSWMATADMIERGAFDEILQGSVEAVAIKGSHHA